LILYNCYSGREKELKAIDLKELTDYELLELAKKVKQEFDDGILEDETIVISVLFQISEEQGKRIMRIKKGGGNYVFIVWFIRCID